MLVLRGDSRVGVPGFNIVPVLDCMRSPFVVNSIELGSLGRVQDGFSASFQEFRRCILGGDSPTRLGPAAPCAESLNCRFFGSSVCCRCCFHSCLALSFLSPCVAFEISRGALVFNFDHEARFGDVVAVNCCFSFQRSRELADSTSASFCSSGRVPISRSPEVGDMVGKELELRGSLSGVRAGECFVSCAFHSSLESDDGLSLIRLQDGD
mmetsp:Transcript_22056/g.32842  ORF Transcript_22056/g.32842 Transcript_22056/m.32842 type:complete len:210 (-) Transcript_22056:5-634(-)